MMAMLKTLGIEKDKPFNPDARQKKLLEEASVLGEEMAKAVSFDKPFAGALFRPDAHWDYVIAVDWTHDKNTTGRWTNSPLIPMKLPPPPRVWPTFRGRWPSIPWCLPGQARPRV